MDRRRFLKVASGVFGVGGVLKIAESLGLPDGWLEPVRVTVSTGTYTGDGRTNREVFFADQTPIFKAVRIIRETGKSSGDFNVKGERYRYEVF